MRVALYIRRSTTDLQPDSLDAQRDLLTKWSREHDHEIVAVFEESSSGRFIEGRDEFQRMIALVKVGAPFEAILVRDVSRWSRAENLDEAGFYEFVCRSHGVAVIFVEESFAPNCSPYSVLMKNLKRAMAAEESLEKIRMVRASHARTIKRGFWPTGSVPFGLKRVLVDDEGVFIRDMAPGDRKALSNQRIKFAPGDSVHAGVVQRIFGRYADDGATVKSVADELNHDRVPSSKGKMWTPAMIAYMLQNEAYAGSLVYRIWRNRKRSSVINLRGSETEDVVRFENAHESLVGRELWDRVQAKLRSKNWRKTDEDILGELKRACIRWRPKTKRQVLPPIDAVRGKYGTSDEDVMRSAMRGATADLRSRLEKDFHVDDFDGGFLLDHLLHVRLKAALPHAKFGACFWRFDFDPSEPFDVVIGLAMSPPPRVEHVETFLFRASSFGRRRKSASPRIDPSIRSKQYLRLSAQEPVAEPLRRAIRFRGTRAEKVFIAAVREKEKLSLREIAEELHWPISLVRAMYRRLDLRGDALPRHLSGASKRVQVLCPHCHRSRSLAPATVLRLETDVCFTCLHRPPVKTPNKLVAVCPACGARRLLTTTEVSQRESGCDSLCAECSRKELGTRSRESADQRRAAK